MAASLIDGPSVVYGPTAAISAATFGSAVGDPDTDAGPDIAYQGFGILDPRFYFQKDKITGFAGSAPAHYASNFFRSVVQIPAALGAANIVPAATPASGVAMTLAAASVGVAVNIPIVPFSAGGINQLPIAGNVTTAALALDFGFGFGNCTSGNPVVTVADSLLYPIGMPVVIGGVGNAGGTVPLLTNVIATSTQTAATQTITLATAPLASNSTAPIATGNIWGPRPTSSTNAFATPTAALPFFAGGVGLFLDARQTIARGVQIVGLSGGTGGIFTVAGWDIYGVPMTEAITLAAGANTVYGKKAFKYIASVTPNFTDGSHNVTVGTNDVFGFAYRSGLYEDMLISWAGAQFVTSTAALTAPLSLNTASTTTTADVRGTIQTGSAGGAGANLGSASNGTISSLAMTGRRLSIQQNLSVAQAAMSTPSNFSTMFGVTQI